MFKITTKKICLCGIVAGIYVVLSLITFPVASGFFQIRLSESLAVLPLLFPESSVSLFVGCAVTNLITGCSLLDVAFGSAITLLSGVLTSVIGVKVKRKGLKIFLGGLFPVVLNSVFLPLVWYFSYGGLSASYVVLALSLFLSESISVFVFGTLVFYKADKLLR